LAPPRSGTRVPSKSWGARGRGVQKLYTFRRAELSEPAKWLKSRAKINRPICPSISHRPKPTCDTQGVNTQSGSPERQSAELQGISNLLAREVRSLSGKRLLCRAAGAEKCFTRRLLKRLQLGQVCRPTFEGGWQENAPWGPPDPKPPRSVKLLEGRNLLSAPLSSKANGTTSLVGPLVANGSSRGLPLRCSPRLLRTRTRPRFGQPAQSSENSRSNRMHLPRS